MNERSHDKQTRELQALYREAGDVEPETGLDRIVRARADQASRDRRPAGRLPWLGGLVTASVAIIAIAVVLQQTPPGKPIPESLVPPAPAEPEAFMAPSMGAQSQQEVSADATRARSETRAKEEDSSLQTHRAPAREALPEAAAERRPRPAAQAEAEPAAPSTEAEDSALERITITGSRLGNADRAVLKSGGDLIETLRELIEAERIDEAHRLLDEAIEHDPGLDLPEDIEQALGRPDSGSP
ncbi:MAG: hypothetical protein WD397_10895 [Wenzhouxiangellaceae bacterium]